MARKRTRWTRELHVRVLNATRAGVRSLADAADAGTQFVGAAAEAVCDDHGRYEREIELHLGAEHEAEGEQ